MRKEKEAEAIRQADKERRRGREGRREEESLPLKRVCMHQFTNGWLERERIVTGSFACGTEDLLAVEIDVYFVLRTRKVQLRLRQVRQGSKNDDRGDDHRRTTIISRDSLDAENNGKSTAPELK